MVILRQLLLLADVLLLCSARTLALRRSEARRSLPLNAWTPPPEYATKTFGHKTMYLAEVSVGSSGQTFRLLVDTGSSTIVVPGAACQFTDGHEHQRFHAKASENANRTVSIQFGRGSLQGHVVRSQICMEGSVPLTEVGFLQERAITAEQATRQKMDVLQDSEGTLASTLGSACTQMSFVVADEESDLLSAAPYDGILGMGPDDPSLGGAEFSLLQRLVADGQLSSNVFTLRLGNAGESSLLLGGIDESELAGGHALWVPLSAMANGYWQFTVMDLLVDGEKQSFGSLQVAVDSGTSLLAADDDLQQWLRERLQPKDCTTVDQLPKLGLLLRDGSALSLLPSDYIDQSQGECHLALMPSKMQSVNGQRLVLGDSFLHRYVTVFDRDNRKLGFGVAAGDDLQHELLPAMFPAPTTTAPPSTTRGAPPAMNVTYSDFVPKTSPPPPTAEELAKDKENQELGVAFAKMPEDLVGSFESTLAKEKAVVSEEKASLSARQEGVKQQVVPEDAGDSGDDENEGTGGNPYLSILASSH